MGNQPCCVSSLRQNQMYSDLLCHSPPTSSYARHLPPLPNTQNPQGSRTHGDQLTDPNNSVFYKSDFPVPSAVTPEEEAKALASKKKKKLRKKKPPPLNNIESPREYTATSNTFFLTNNPFENYSDPSYKITTTQGEAGLDAQEDFSKKLATEYWENGEEDKNLSVRLSDKRLLENTAAFAALNKYYQEEVLNSAKDVNCAGMVAQKVGEDEDVVDSDLDEDEIQFDPHSQEALKNSQPVKSNELAPFRHILPKEDPTSRTAEEDLITWDIRPSVIHEEPDASLVRASPYSYSPNPKDRSNENRYIKESRNDRITTEETTRRYSEYISKLQDNTLTAVKQTENHAPQRYLTPFNVSDGTEEPTIRIPEIAYEASVVHFSHNISPQKEQSSRLKFDETIYSPDQSGKSRKPQDENAWDIQRSLVELSTKNNGEIPVENFSGTFRKTSQQELSAKDKSWVDQIGSATSQYIDQVSPLRERALIRNDRSNDFNGLQDNKTKNAWLGADRAHEDGKQDLLGQLGSRNYSQVYKIPGADYSRGNVKKVEGSERWESVQKDVQKLIDNAFKPKTSLLDHYLKPKDDVKKSGIHKPKVSWKEELEGRSEYTNPFSGEEKHNSTMKGREGMYESRTSDGLDKANKSLQGYLSQDRRDMGVGSRGYMNINATGK